MPKDTKRSYSFRNRVKNPLFEAGLKLLPVAPNTPLLRSCLIHDNAEKSVQVKNAPKWLTNLSEIAVNEDGEIVSEGVYTTDEIKSSNGRKILALDRFCDHYQPKYQSREVSLLFHTFTRANHSNLTMRGMLDNVKYHYRKMLNRQIRGYIWTAEVSQKGHWHYHLAVAVDRINFRGSKIPDELKFEDLWGQRTGVEFVRKNIRHYMAKYFAKENARVIGTRSYGISRNLR